MNRKREQIIVDFYNDPDINAAIGKMNPPDLRDDLKSEMFVVLCEMSDEKFFQLHDQKIMKWFLVRTMLNMIKSDRSTFAKKFRQIFVELSGGFMDRVDNNENEHDTHEAIKNEMSQLHWYERELFRLYSQTKNISLMSREIGIPYRSISKTISETRKKMKQNLKASQNKDPEKFIVFAKCEIGFHFSGDAKSPQAIADEIEIFNQLIKSKMIGLETGNAKIKSFGDLRITKLFP